jgi:menaquinol-cytochrome c reductase iron-sulfur subunit
MSQLPDNAAQLQASAAESEARALDRSRRTFLFKVSVLLNAAIGAVLAVPIIGYLLGPVSKRDAGSWVNLGSLDAFPVGETTLANFDSPVARLGDGQTAKVACWVRRLSKQQFQVFAINCAHLGCPVRWFSQSALFLCPCHGGAYYADGSRASGPPERGLFEYRVKLDGTSLLIHAADMPTLATQASCGKPPLVQLETRSDAHEESNPWQA